MIRLEKVRSICHWVQLYRLYMQAFPAEERKPFFIIVNLYRQKKSDIWCVCQGRKMLGFATTINGDKVILLDYLAVKAACRGKGIGSQILRALQEKYKDKGIVVEIENPYEVCAAQQERIRRKQFYLNCGMKELQVMAEVFGVDMELLAWNCSMDFEGYHAFYQENNGSWAAEHILPKDYPKQ